MQFEENSNLVNYHYKFISMKNIIILFVSSDNFNV